MLLPLILMFTVVPIVELYLLFKAGQLWGAWNTIAIVFITGVLGAYFAKKEGREILRRLQRKMSQGGLPADEVIHGAMVFGGGLLLLTPGFVTDVLGFSFVFPVTRYLWVFMAKAYLAKKIKEGSVKVYTSYTQGGFEAGPRPPFEDPFQRPRKIKDVNKKSDQ